MISFAFVTSPALIASMLFLMPPKADIAPASSVTSPAVATILVKSLARFDSVMPALYFVMIASIVVLTDFSEAIRFCTPTMSRSLPSSATFSFVSMSDRAFFFSPSWLKLPSIGSKRAAFVRSWFTNDSSCA